MIPHCRHRADPLLAAAPELAVVAIVERALDVLVTTLRNEHPTVDDPGRRDDPRSLRRARQLIERIECSRAALQRYTQAVREGFEVAPGDDLPF